MFLLLFLCIGSNRSLALGVICNPKGIDWPNGDMVVGDPMGENMQVAGGDYSSIAISNYKGKKFHLSEVYSSYFYSRR